MKPLHFLAAIEKIQKGREEARIQELEEKKRIEEEKQQLAKEEMEKKREEEELVLAEEDEKRKKLREDRLKKREEKRGDSWISGEDEASMNDSDSSMKIKQEDIKEEDNDSFSTEKTNLSTVKEFDSKSEVKSEIKSEVKDEKDTKSFDKRPGDSRLTAINHKVHKFLYLSFSNLR